MAKLLQKEGTSLENEQAKRRKRINLYKRIIIIFIISLILLPTILCIVLFIRINVLNRELEEVRKLKLDKIYYADNQQNDVDDKGPEPDFYPDMDSHMSVNTEKSTTSETETEPPTTDVPETEPPITDVPETEPPTTVVIPGATQYSEEVQAAISEGRKVVYLTYDDGPSPNTYWLLDILDKYDVKVTFFVNGYPGYEDELIEIYNRGHSIAMHTYTHQYATVYGGIESFKTEIDLLSDHIYNLVGIRPNVFRFPGGSSTEMTNEIHTYIDYLNQNGIVYFDWNVGSQDAVPNPLPATQIYNNVMSGIATKDVSVVLMHDAYGKETTIQASELIIQSLIEQNALILPITDDTVPVHHNVN